MSDESDNFDDMDAALEAMLEAAAHEEAVYELETRLTNQTVVDISRQAEAIGISTPPSFATWILGRGFVDEPIPAQPGFLRYMNRIDALQTTLLELELIKQHGAQTFEQESIDGCITEIIDLDDPEWPLWRQLASTVLDRVELLQLGPAEIAVIKEREAANEAKQLADLQKMRAIGTALEERLGPRDDIIAVNYALFSLELLSQNMDLALIDFQADDEAGLGLQELKDYAIYKVADTYSIDDDQAKAVVFEIITKVREQN